MLPVCDRHAVSDRAARVATSARPPRGRDRTPATGGPPPAVARLLDLQRSAGNAAVTRLLRAPLTAPPTAAGPATTPAPGATTARARFEAQLRNRWSVASVRAGTEADQLAEMRRMTPSSQPAPSSIGAWQAWDPDPDSDLYDDILDAFEAMGAALGGIPDVNDLRFAATDYENVGGTAEARPRHGATYGAGLLNVFSRIEGMSWGLPDGRSSAGAPAGVSFGSASDSRRRILVHELSHGVFERFGNPSLAGGNTQLFAEWAQAGGWVNGRLEQSGIPLTRANWNDDWPEQPVSGYATTNLMEDFAESLMCFVERPDVLRDRSPARHQFIVSRLGAWRGGLRAARPLTRPLLRPGPRGDFLGPADDARYA
jgi:hypothetical protein